MTRGLSAKKKILSIAERETLVSEKKDLETNLRDATQYGAGTGASAINTGAIKSQINRLDKGLHDGLAPKIGGLKKDALAKRAEELRERFTQGMPTRFEMDHPGRAPGAVGKHMKWDKRTQADREEYRTIMRTLEPDDPTAVDVEKFRKSGRPRED